MSLQGFNSGVPLENSHQVVAPAISQIICATKCSEALSACINRSDPKACLEALGMHECIQCLP